MTITQSTFSGGLPLRPYQRECLETILDKHRAGVGRQLVSMATGSGKTVVFSHLIHRMQRPSIVLAHTTELLEQARDKIRMVCPHLDVGIVNGDSKQFNKQVVVASVQSARQPRTLSKLIKRDFGLLICDEAHHFAADTLRGVVNALGFDGSNDKLLSGYSATPFRQDGRGLGEVFDEIVYEKSIGSLIEEGYLCPPRGIRVATDLDLHELALSRGDYSSKGMATVMDTEEVRSLVVKAYLEHGEGRPTLCFTCSVKHAQHLEQDLKTAGVSAASVHGGTPREERARILGDYKAGNIQVVTNCQVLTEGFDAPSTACIIVGRPTHSRGLYQQMVGRGLRRFPGKQDCVVIDFNDRNHSLCNAAALLPDAEVAEKQKEERRRRELELLEDVPSKLNKKLKTAYVSSNLLGDSFNWARAGGAYTLKGNDDLELRVVEVGGNYRVEGHSPKGTTNIVEGLTFEYAFAAAEDFGRQHKDLFILADRDAAWRERPISDKQLSMFRSKGYRAGIEHLTRGQASDLIRTGVLRRVG